MSTNKLYDVIIVGASKEGLKLCSLLLTQKPDIKIAFISKHFNFQPATLDLTGVDRFEQEAEFSYYRHRLLGIYMTKEDPVFGKAVVLATGSTPIKSMLKNSNIQYNLTDVKGNKTSVAMVYGNNDMAANYALTLAKKFKYVYLCTKEFKLTCASKYGKKIENTANIVHLPNCNIIACKNDKDGNLSEVLLDTYSSIKCTTLVMALGRKPDVSGFDKRMLKLDSEGYIVTKEFSETTEIPNIFAVGACAKTTESQRLSTVATTILNRIK